MNNSIEVHSDYTCSGCGACVCICPKDAIKIQLNKAGFYEATVDDKKCVNCGLCMKVCTRYDDKIEGVNLYESKVYAAQSTSKETVFNSTSGGIAFEMTRWALENGYSVTGVAYNTDNNKAEHITITGEDEIYKLTGSKYLQSYSERAFKEIVESALNDRNRKYLVFGTPCQIAGLKKVLEIKNIRKQFLLAEIFCHGVPSYRLWEEQCKRIQKKLGSQQFDEVKFRYKKDDWHSYCMRVNSGNKVFYGNRERELFWQVFFENILLGDSCYNCRMRKEISAADIRLGDYWGSRYQNRGDGVSVILTSTTEGDNCVSQLIKQNRIRLMECGGVKEILSAQNMKGYHQKELHDKAMKPLSKEGNILKAIKISRKGMTAKQKLKRRVLYANGFIPKKISKKMKFILRKKL